MWQEAIAIILETELKRLDKPECYFNFLPAELRKKRDFMAAFLQEVGMKPIQPEGGYFMMVDWAALGDWILFYFFVFKESLSINIMILLTCFEIQILNHDCREQIGNGSGNRYEERLSLHQVDD